MSDTMVRTADETRSRRRRTRRAKRTAVRAFGLIGVAAVLALGSFAVIRESAPPETPALGDGSEGEQLTVLVALTSLDDPSQSADSLALIGIDRRTGRDPVALLIPTGTFGQIPGQSSIEEIGKALIFGRESLQQTTIENLLGIVIDRTVVMSDVDLARIIEGVGGISVDVPQTLHETAPDGTRELAFSAGPQTMDGASAVTFLTYRAEGESELDRTVRAQRVWEGIVGAAGANGPSLEEGLEAIPAVVPSAARALSQVLQAFAAAPEDERTFDVLAVTSVGGSSIDDVYTLDDSAAAQIERLFGGSVPPLVTELGSRPRVELRNGVGVPEIGGRAAALLVPEGFKLEVTGNAASFDTRSTRIIVYGEDEASLALAARVAELLGVGQVEVGTRGQTVVDLTIVIGRDFTRRN